MEGATSNSYHDSTHQALRYLEASLHPLGCWWVWWAVLMAGKAFYFPQHPTLSALLPQPSVTQSVHRSSWTARHETPAGYPLMGATSRSSWWEIGWSDRSLVFLLLLSPSLLPSLCLHHPLSVNSLAASEWGWVEEVDWKQGELFLVEEETPPLIPWLLHPQHLAEAVPAPCWVFDLLGVLG